jgi:hypothetical protein
MTAQKSEKITHEGRLVGICSNPIDANSSMEIVDRLVSDDLPAAWAVRFFGAATSGVGRQ